MRKQILFIALITAFGVFAKAEANTRDNKTVGTSNVNVSQYNGSPVGPTNPLDVKLDPSATFTIQQAMGTSNTVVQPTASQLNAQVSGDVAAGTQDSGNPVKIGARAYSTIPTIVTDGQRVNIAADRHGRQVIIPLQTRVLTQQSSLLTLNSTNEIALITAVSTPATFLDLVSITCANTSATPVRLDIRDLPGGPVVSSLQFPANDTRTIIYQLPFKQTNTNNNWTAQLGTAITDLRCVAQFIQNQ